MQHDTAQLHCTLNRTPFSSAQRYSPLQARRPRWAGSTRTVSGRRDFERKSTGDNMPRVSPNDMPVPCTRKPICRRRKRIGCGREKSCFDWLENSGKRRFGCSGCCGKHGKALYEVHLKHMSEQSREDVCIMLSFAQSATL